MTSRNAWRQLGIREDAFDRLRIQIAKFVPSPNNGPGRAPMDAQCLRLFVQRGISRSDESVCNVLNMNRSARSRRAPNNTEART
jgi:hypothetical protein